MSRSAPTRTIAVIALLLVSWLFTLATRGTAAPELPRSELGGACYCRAMGQLSCVGVTTKGQCDKHCTEAFCDEWFWLERLTCWNWGYGG